MAVSRRKQPFTRLKEWTGNSLTDYSLALVKGGEDALHGPRPGAEIANRHATTASACPRHPSWAELVAIGG